jgi:hypothetical protein
MEAQLVGRRGVLHSFGCHRTSPIGYIAGPAEVALSLRWIYVSIVMGRLDHLDIVLFYINKC